MLKAEPAIRSLFRGGSAFRRGLNGYKSIKYYVPISLEMRPYHLALDTPVASCAIVRMPQKANWSGVR